MRAVLKFAVFGFGLLLVALVVFAWTGFPTAITVRNNSDRTLNEVLVVVQDHTLKFPSLSPGDSARRWHRNSGADDNFTFTAVRDDGMKIQKEDGYVTSGSFFGSVEFTVAPVGEIAFAEKWN